MPSEERKITCERCGREETHIIHYRDVCSECDREEMDEIFKNNSLENLKYFALVVVAAVLFVVAIWAVMLIAQ